MEDRQLLEQMFNGALREFATTDQDKAPGRAGVVVCGNMPITITIHGGLHLGCLGEKSKAQ